MLEGATDFQDIIDVEGMVKLGDGRILVTTNGIDQNQLSKAGEHIVGAGDDALVEIYAIKRIFGSPLDQPEGAVASAGFLPYPIEVGEGQFKRADEYDRETLEGVVFGNNRGQFMDLKTTLKGFLMDKFNMYVMRGEQKLFERYMNTKFQQSSSASTKDLQKAVDLLKRRGVNTQEVFGDDINLADVREFSFLDTIEGQTEYVTRPHKVSSALKDSRETAERFVRYHQKFISLLKTSQREGLEESLDSIEARVSALYGAAESTEDILNLEAEYNALAHIRVARISLQTYEDRDSYESEVGNIDEALASAEANPTPFQQFVQHTRKQDKMEELYQAGKKKQKEAADDVAASGEVETNTFYRRKYRGKDIEFISKQRINQQDMIKLKNTMFASALVLAKQKKDQYGDRVQEGYFTEDDLSFDLPPNQDRNAGPIEFRIGEYKAQMIVANSVFTEWANEQFSVVQSYLEENKGLFIPTRGKGTERYNQKVSHYDRLLAMIKARIVGELDESVTGERTFNKKGITYESNDEGAA